MAAIFLQILTIETVSRMEAMEGTGARRKSRLVAAENTCLGGISWCICLGASSSASNLVLCRWLPLVNGAFG